MSCNGYTSQKKRVSTWQRADDLSEVAKVRVQGSELRVLDVLAVVQVLGSCRAVKGRVVEAAEQRGDLIGQQRGVFSRALNSVACTRTTSTKGADLCSSVSVPSLPPLFHMWACGRVGAGRRCTRARTTSLDRWAVVRSDNRLRQRLRRIVVCEATGSVRGVHTLGEDIDTAATATAESLCHRLKRPFGGWPGARGRVCVYVWRSRSVGVEKGADVEPSTSWPRGSTDFGETRT